MMTWAIRPALDFKELQASRRLRIEMPPAAGVELEKQSGIRVDVDNLAGEFPPVAEQPGASAEVRAEFAPLGRQFHVGRWPLSCE